MKKKFQLAILGMLLMAVIAGGVWFLTGGPNREGTPETPTENPGVNGSNPAKPFNMSNLKPMDFKLQQRTEEFPYATFTVEGSDDVYVRIIQNANMIFTYGDQFCQLTYQPGETEDDFRVDIVSVLNGEVLHSFPAELFPESYNLPDTYGLVELGENFEGLTLDEDGVLWAYYVLWGDFGYQVIISPCKSGVTEEDVVLLGDLGTKVWPSPYKFIVQDGYAFLCYGKNSFSIANLSDGSYVNPARVDYINDLPLNEDPAEMDSVSDFCVDEDGNAYYLRYSMGGTAKIEKYSPKEQKAVWSKAVSELSEKGMEYAFCDRISYTASGGLFVAGRVDSMDLGGICWLDPETGEDFQELINFHADVDAPPEELDSKQIQGFIVDNQYRIYASYYEFDFSSDDPADQYSKRTVFILEPEAREVTAEAEQVTLTITAPYQVESIANAIHVYQQAHPEVNVVWDTQYISRDEFQKNILEYKDQIALRTMTGEVGDLQMITGSGLSQDIITGTDAFLDLSGYLEDCPFREELGWNVIETLRGEDGAIRGIPIAVRPNGYAWNMTLLEELGRPVEPATAAWSELLDLALRWKEEGAAYSLMAAEPSQRQSREETMLMEMLLANLYSAEQADGTVQLDQPWLRELLEKWSQLHGSKQLVGASDSYDGIGENVLMTSSPSTNIGEAAYVLAEAEVSQGIDFYATAVPKGETSTEQQGYAFCWGIPASSKNQEAAWGLLQHIISSSGLPRYTYTTDTLVTNTAAQEKLARYCERISWKYSGMIETSRKYYDQLCALQQIPYSRLDEPYGWVAAVFEPVKAYIDGKISLDEAMRTANENWERFVLE